MEESSQPGNNVHESICNSWIREHIDVHFFGPKLLLNGQLQFENKYLYSPMQAGIILVDSKHGLFIMIVWTLHQLTWHVNTLPRNKYMDSPDCSHITCTVLVKHANLREQYIYAA
jgi:hypothetical protein